MRNFLSTWESISLTRALFYGIGLDVKSCSKVPVELLNVYSFEQIGIGIKIILNFKEEVASFCNYYNKTMTDMQINYDRCIVYREYWQQISYVSEMVKAFTSWWNYPHTHNLNIHHHMNRNLLLAAIISHLNQTDFFVYDDIKLYFNIILWYKSNFKCLLWCFPTSFNKFLTSIIHATCHINHSFHNYG